MQILKRRMMIYILAFVSLNISAQGLKIGDQAPDFKQKSVDGELFELSSLKGKIVLIDFWASWCGPCRRENPHVVEAYNKYKDVKFGEAEGFTVLSVSLDMIARDWKKAIEKDKLVWPYHVSDLKGWRNTVAKQYGVKSVPTNYLIDENGKILAINLRGDNLKKELRKLQRRTKKKFWD